MSTNRRRPSSAVVPEEKMPRGPNGRKLCRQCQTEVKPPRRTFCSRACVEQWRLLGDPNYMRFRVKQRDKGVCANCRLDTRALEHGLQLLRELAWGTHARAGIEGLGRAVNGLREVLKVGGRRSLWDADHKVEVVRGGGECGLENMQTLCVWCHRAKTARLAAERAAERTNNHKEAIC